MRILWEKWLEFQSEHRRAAGLAMLLGVLALVALGVNWPRGDRDSAGGIAETLELLQAKQQELHALLEEKQRLERPLALLAARPELLWSTERDGNPATEFRRKAESLATGAGVRLKSIGSVQESHPASGVTVYEINLQGQLSCEELLKLLALLQQPGQRALRWSALNLNPDNLRAPNHLIFNGTLQAVAVNHPGIRALGERQP